MSEGLYFIAIVPPQEVCEEITKLKHLVKEKFDSSHALNAPPHITLHMPFKWRDKKVEQLTGLIDHLNDEWEPFEIELKNFDFFEPRVVFVDVVENGLLNKKQKQVMGACRRELKLDNANYKDRPFHPHVTIAFRDLKKPQFYEARNFFKFQEASFIFQVERVELLRKEDKNWQVNRLYT